MNSEDFLAFNTSNDNSEVLNTKITSYNDIQPLILHESIPWLIGQINNREQPFVRLHNEILDFISYITPNDNEKSNRELVVADLRKLVMKLWPNATVKVFGSQMTDLLIPGSDIDITIMNVPMPSNNSNRDVIKMLEALADGLRFQVPFEVSYLEVISSAKFPIIKYDHKNTGISVDVCINNSSGLDTGHLMKMYLRLYPMLRPLTIIIKEYLAQRRLHETYNGGIGSFVLLNMIISLIQHRQRVAYMYHQEPYWNLGVLLLEFFRFYGSQFNYVTTGISIAHSEFYSKRERGDEWGANKLTLSVENPDPNVNPAVDIGRNSFMIGKVRRSFEHAGQVLTAILSSNSESVTSYLAYLIRVDDPLLQGRIMAVINTSTMSEVIMIVDDDDDVVMKVAEDGNEVQVDVRPSSANDTVSRAVATFKQMQDPSTSVAKPPALSAPIVDDEDNNIASAAVDVHQRKKVKAKRINSNITDKNSQSLSHAQASTLSQTMTPSLLLPPPPPPFVSASSSGNNYLQQKIAGSMNQRKRTFTQTKQPAGNTNVNTHFLANTNNDRIIRCKNN